MTRELLDNLSKVTDFTVIICGDESSAVIDEVPNVRKVVVSKSRYLEMGLFVEHDTMWRCGDYCLYAVMQDLPGFDRVWMIEPDVYINADINCFFHEMEQAVLGFDFIAVRFSKSNETSPWQETMEPFYVERYICQYPLVSVTYRAIKTLLEQRLRMSKFFLREMEISGKLATPYPNDEAFTATVCMNTGYSCADLNSFGITRYDSDTFSFLVPSSRKYLELSPPDQMVYHPVVSGDPFKAKADFLLEYCRDKVGQQDRPRVLRPVLETIGHKLAIEVSYEYAVAYLSTAEALLASSAP